MGAVFFERSRPRDERERLVSRASGSDGGALRVMKRLRSKPPDAEGMKKRVDDALLKDLLGEPLSERELRIVQYVKYGFGCAACATGTLARVRFRASEIYRSRTEKKSV